MPFVVGETIGSYRLVEQLGQGGMATVYKAYHAALDRYVAIKVLHPALMDEAGFLARFQREARLIAKLEHPNIVPVYDYAEYEGRPYLVMKYIQGQTLKAYMTNRRLELQDTLRIVEAVGAGLAYAHQQNILHRDIKPSNVLLTDEGQVYLADFGLARMAANTSSTMSGDMLIGTPQYISPEQAISKPDLDGRTDIYSFGVMLYEMVVGKVPFTSDTPFSIIHDHLYTPLPMPRKVNPQVSPAVERVLLKALAKERDDRYQNVNAMVQAFRAAVGGAAPGNVPQRADPGSGVDTIQDKPPVIIPFEPVKEAKPPQAIPPQAIPPQATPPQAEQPRAEKTPTPRPGRPAEPQRVEKTPTPKPNRMVEPPAAERAPVEPRLPTVEAPFQPQGVEVQVGMGAILPAQPRSKWWIIPLVVLSLIVLALLVLGGLRVIRKRQLASASTTPAAATLPANTAIAANQSTPVPAENANGMPLSMDAKAALKGALASAQGGDYAGMLQGLETVRAEAAKNASAGNASGFHAAQQYLDDQQAWLPAAVFGLMRYEQQPEEFTPESLSRLHMDLYRAAREPLFGDFLSKTQANPLFSAAELRYRLYYGGNVQEIQGRLAKLMKNDLFATRFPEAYLLEAEIKGKTGDNQRAKDQIDQVNANPDLPVWVKDEARLLSEQFK